MPLRSLADGQVASTSTLVYQAPGNQSVTLTYLSLYNTNATKQTVNVYILRSGSSTARQIRRFTLEQYQHAQGISAEEQPTLSPADKILMSTTTASAVDYVISGDVL